MDKIKKIISKNKKKILLLFSFSFIFLFLFSNLSINVKGIDNYSNYLYNQPIVVNQDKAMILNEIASGSNNYRNYFDSGFTFPSKLSNQMFNAFATDFSQYSLSQIYLDNLDDSLAFKSNNNSENIETRQDIEIQESDIINGTIKENIIISESINPNIDIISEWTGIGFHFDDLDDYPDLEGLGGTSRIMDLEQDTTVLDRYGFTDTTIDLPIEFVNISFTYYNEFDTNPELNISIFESSDMISYHIFTLSYSITNILEMSYVLPINSLFLNNIEVQLDCTNTFNFYIDVYSLQLQLLYNNITNINSDNSESGEIFPAEYTFTDQSGENPTDWTIVETTGSVDVITDLDAHSDIVEIHDIGGSQTQMYQTISQTYGTIEFWIQSTDSTLQNTFRMDFGVDSVLALQIDSDKFQYYDGIWNDVGLVVIDDTWYHILVNFECGVSGYKGLAQYDYNIEINGNPYGDYNFALNKASLNKIIFYSGSADSGYYYYIDAIDYSWSTGYFLNRNYYPSFTQIYFISDTSISFLNNPDYTPVFLSVYTELCMNQSGNLELSFFNYDLNLYTHKISINDINQFNLNSFIFNESGYYRYNKFQLKLSVNNSISFKLYLKSLYLNITYIKINENGFHDISVKFDKQKDDTTNIGYDLFQIKVYDNYLLYKYSEINDLSDNYIINWINLTFDSIETLEINYHIRFGLNTLDIEITNVLVEIYIDSEIVLSFLEQDRKYFLGKHYKPEYNYTCNNRNFLNLTGVIGNYSYNCLKGIRVLSGENDLIYNRFFIIPLFSYNIDVSQRSISQSDLAIENEPDSPKGAKYWSYTTFRLVSDTSIEIEIGNWSFDFIPVKVESYQAKYYYSPEAISKRSLGDWTWKLTDDIRLSLNFIRNAVVFILNLILLFFQYLMYLVVASLSFIFMFLGSYIVAFLYNICIYYIYIGLLWCLWFLWTLLLWSWSVVLWIWLNILMPILEWLYTVFLPLILEAIIMIMAFMITCFIYVLTLGQVDFWSTYDNVYDILWMLVDFIVEWITVFTVNFEYILMFILWYLICGALIYFRYLYSRARGNINRAEQLYYTFQIYISPIVFIWNLISKLLESTPEL